MNNHYNSNDGADKYHDELDEVFHDALDFIPAGSFRKSLAHHKVEFCVGEDFEELKCSSFDHITLSDEPLERDVLPYFKDPKIKISFWTIIKDAIGKDITKLSVPVYFNDPTSILQRTASSMEYNDLLDKAIAEPDPLRRLIYVSVYSITLLTLLERNTTKPFNPLLGETYELVTKGFRFLAEQVAHHPPTTAFHCEGYSGYKVWSCNRAKTKFTGKNLQFLQ